MTETIQQLKEDIAVLQEKLQKLEELEKTKSPVEEAYKDWWGKYPELETDGEFDVTRWHGFRAGYHFAYEEKVAQEPEDIMWKPVALRFGEKLSDVGPDGYYDFTPEEWFDWVVNTYEEKVSETAQEPETLLDVIRNLGYSYDCCYEIVDAVEKFEKSKEPEENEWKSVALRFGEKLSGYLSDGYYELSPAAWFRWAVFTYGKGQQIKDAVRESKKWCEEHPNENPLDWVKPREPEEWDIKVETDYLTGKARHKTKIVDKDGNDYKPKPYTIEELLKPKTPEEQEPEMLLLRQGKVDIVDYNHRTHYRIEYTDSFSGVYKWFVRKLGEVAFLEEIRDVNNYAPLEELYQKEVMKQKEEYPYNPHKKYTPEETEKSLREAFVKAQQTEKWKEIQRKIDEEDSDKNFKNSLDLIREWGEKNKPPTLKELLWEWWEDIFTRNSDLDADASIDILVDMIDKKFIPPSSDRNGYEWEKCLKIMRDKLR